MENHFREKLNSVFSHISKPNSLIQSEDMRSFVFGDFGKREDRRFYDEILDLDVLGEVIMSLASI